MKQRIKFDRKRIRSWSLYAIRKSDGKYYIGLTSRKDPHKRIRQHGGYKGAYVNRGLKVEEIIEIRKLGKMPAWQAENLENDMALEYMNTYGKQKVRGGRMTRKGRLFLREYNPGTNEIIIQTIGLTVVILVIIFFCFYILLNNV